MPRCRLVSILLVVLLGSLVAGAQDNGTAQPTPPPPAADELRSPRATMETFLGAFYVEGELDSGRGGSPSPGPAAPCRRR